jgi:hypothetical protein
MLVGYKYSKSILYNIAKNAILEGNRYLTRTELCRITGIHHSKFYKYGVIIHDVNLELGYVRKGLMPHPSIEDRDTYILALVEQYKKCIIKKGSSVSLLEFSKETQVTYSTLYRYKIDVKSIHLECGILYNVYDLSLSDKEIIDRLIELIHLKKRYISYVDLSRDLDISHTLICQRKFP